MIKKILNFLLEFVTQFRYKYNLLPTYNYKVGDRVMFNWKAKVQIGNVIQDDINDVLVIKEVSHKRNEMIDYQNTRTKEIGSCDAHWLKRA